MTQAYVDANVILRFLVGDPPEMAQQAADLFKAVEDGKLSLVVDDIVIAEAVWVLESFYGHPRLRIAEALRDFLAQDGIEAEEKSTLLRALVLYEARNVDFADALVAVRMQERGISRIFSFDTHFDRLSLVERQVPGMPVGESHEEGPGSTADSP